MSKKPVQPDRVSKQQKDGEEQEGQGNLAPAPQLRHILWGVCGERDRQNGCHMPEECGLRRLLWFSFQFCHLLCVLQQDA